MDDNKWAVFYDTLIEHYKTISNSIFNEASADEDDVAKDKEEDKLIIGDESGKEQWLSILKEDNNGEKLIGKINELLQIKNNRINELKVAYNGLIQKYSTNKKICDESCQTIEPYIKDGVKGYIYFLTKAFQNQHDSVIKAKKIVEDKKKDLDVAYCFNIFVLALLVVACVFAQVHLFSLIKGVGDQDFFVLTNCILVAAMIILLVGECFVVLGLIKLSKKRNYILQRLELIKNKIEMHKMSKFEIDRDLENVLEEMK